MVWESQRTSRSPRVRSRLAQREQKKLFRQSLLYIFLAIGLGVVFIFFILPKTVSLLFSVIDSENTFSNQDTLPPQVPIIAAPATATTQELLTVSGYGEPESTIYLLLNGSVASETVVASDGTFSQDITLPEGANSVSAYAKDAAGNESVTSTQYTITRDTTAPELVIEQPTAGQSFKLATNQSITVSGTTESRAKITVNGRLTLADMEGKFSTTYFLQEGENELTLVATDEAGNTTEQKVTVSFSFQ